MSHVRLTTPLKFGLVALALGSVASLQAVHDRAAAPFIKEKKVAAIKLAEPALPSSSTLQALSLGNRQALADILWIQTIQYFGAGSAYANYPSLGKMLNRIVDLDPKFAKPYEFGLVTLPFMQQADEAVALGEKAQKEIPGNGLLTYYLATVYHLNIKDYARAAELYQKAATEEGAPGAALSLAGSALNKIDSTAADRLVAAAFWASVYENANEPGEEAERERAKSWYEQMQIVYSLEISAAQYKERTGSFPATLEDLVKSGQITAVPASPVNRKMSIDPSTGKVDFSELAE